MVYANSSVTAFENITFSGQSPNSQVIFLIDFGGLPANKFKNVGFFTSGNADFNSQHLIIRNRLNIGTGFFFDTINFVAGPHLGGGMAIRGDNPD